MTFMHDYLGSARVTLSTTAEPLQSSSYHPYGTERTSTGSGARTSYIGREHDNETDLGFYGVRLYEPEYGRFLSTDVLWGKYLPLQPYQYAGNNPVAIVDPTGMAGEDPKEAERVSSTVSLGAAVAGVVAGVGEIVGGFTAMLAPTGVSQVGGAVLISMGIGTVSFSGAKLVDAIDAVGDDRPVSDIPTGYGELTGGAVDKGLGGSGELGELFGGLLQGATTGKLLMFGVQSAASSSDALLLAPKMEGLTNATLGLEVISTSHTVGTATGLIQRSSPKVVEPVNASERTSRFESVPTQQQW
jgi:RHS repeat-associated protein